jgi:type IV pilus biogenesis protein CpaD/CtpE
MTGNHVPPLFSGVLAAALLALMAGCAAVPPLQRENLGDPIMKLYYDRQERDLNIHIYERREGSSGATGGPGGGCGC